MADPQFGFRNVSQLGESLVGDQLGLNVYCWLQWGLLGIGAFTNVAMTDLSPHGSKPSAKLRPVLDPRYPAPAGQTAIFEGNRQDWVWESGVPYSTQPVAISGVSVDGAFVAASATGTYSHKVRYPEGRVVFDAPLPTGADVRAEFSYRQVHVRRADEPWFQTLLYRSFRVDEDFQTPGGSGGAWDVLAQNRVPLPAYVVEPLDRVSLKPLEVGSHARVHRQDVLVHCLAETPWDRRRLHDVLVEQYDQTVRTFDRDAAPLPLDRFGTPVSGAMTYPDLVRAHPWRPFRVADVDSTPQEELGGKLYWTTVRLRLEIDAP